MDKLEGITRHGIASLGELARKSVFDRLRANNGEFKVDTDIRIIVEGQNLPRPCNDHLKYEH